MTHVVTLWHKPQTMLAWQQKNGFLREKSFILSIYSLIIIGVRRENLFVMKWNAFYPKKNSIVTLGQPTGGPMT